MTKEGLVIDEEHAMDCSRAVGLVVPMGDGEEFGGEDKKSDLGGAQDTDYKCSRDNYSTYKATWTENINSLN